MKLRVNENSLRFRLSPGEVTDLLEQKQVRHQLALGEGAGDHLIYVVEIVSGLESMDFVFQGGALIVRVPEVAATEWANTKTIGLNHTVSVPGGSLELTVEKDLKRS